jgi:hypothetical protein
VLCKNLTTFQSININPGQYHANMWRNEAACDEMQNGKDTMSNINARIVFCHLERMTGCHEATSFTEFGDGSELCSCPHQSITEPVPRAMLSWWSIWNLDLLDEVK